MINISVVILVLLNLLLQSLSISLSIKQKRSPAECASPLELQMKCFYSLLYLLGLFVAVAVVLC